MSGRSPQAYRDELGSARAVRGALVRACWRTRGARLTLLALAAEALLCEAVASLALIGAALRRLGGAA